MLHPTLFDVTFRNYSCLSLVTFDALLCVLLHLLFCLLAEHSLAVFSVSRWPLLSSGMVVNCRETIYSL